MIARGALAAVASAVMSVLASLLVAATAFAASPTPGIGGDPRSSGQGPGLVGEPFLAVLAVVAIGVGALVVTLVYIRMTGGKRS